MNDPAAAVISVVGLGYVGLPAAIEFARYYPTIGFDINETRVRELQEGYDRNEESAKEDLIQPNLQFTSQLQELNKANFHIVAVPTPIDDAKNPDLKPILGASQTLGSVLKRGDIVVYESTVYPGLTEEECVPVLEKFSGLKCGVDFKVGYSPERMNPGDKEHGFTQITKVVSGQDEEALARVAQLYGRVVKAGIHKAPSIRVAEAAKVIENTQRDLNIALMNELSLVFDKMGLDTNAVLEAAGTKWNFLKFSPGLVGGHCIGVDPYYLTYKAEMLGYHPQVILAGRRINDNMGKHIAQKMIKEMIRAGHAIRNSRVTVLGLTFKENVRDLRNSRVVDIINELEEYGVQVQACDPMVTPEMAKKNFNVRLYPDDDLPPAQGLIAAVAHRQFKNFSQEKIKSLLAPNAIVVDVKAVFADKKLQSEGISYLGI